MLHRIGLFCVATGEDGKLVTGQAAVTLKLEEMASDRTKGAITLSTLEPFQTLQCEVEEELNRHHRHRHQRRLQHHPSFLLPVLLLQLGARASDALRDCRCKPRETLWISSSEAGLSLGVLQGLLAEFQMKVVVVLPLGSSPKMDAAKTKMTFCKICVDKWHLDEHAMKSLQAWQPGA